MSGIGASMSLGSGLTWSHSTETIFPEKILSVLFAYFGATPDAAQGPSVAGPGTRRRPAVRRASTLALVCPHTKPLILNPF